MSERDERIDRPKAPENSQEHSIDRLSEAFENSARRWELIVYPSLFAFIILAAYGFYLVYSLARDVHYLAISVDSNMTVLASNMQSVSQDMHHLQSNVHTMSTNVQTMAANLTDINQNVSTLEPMLTNMNSMDRSIQSINYATHYMRNDVAGMNHSVSRPMSFMNTFMPW